MAVDELRRILDQTLEDLRLSRSEGRALDAVIAELAPRPADKARLRSEAFELAKEALTGRADQGRQILEWLEDVVKRLLPEPPAAARPTRAEAWFSPGERCLDAILAAFDAAKHQADVCVFTITDDRIARAMLDAHARGVRMRVITDDEKAEDRGSDVHRLERAGIAVRLDHDPAHMHHKFAVFDQAVLLTGSYNWTRSAAAVNAENLLVSDDRRLVEPFGRCFEELWSITSSPLR